MQSSTKTESPSSIRSTLFDDEEFMDDALDSVLGYVTDPVCTTLKIKLHITLDNSYMYTYYNIYCFT